MVIILLYPLNTHSSGLPWIEFIKCWSSRFDIVPSEFESKLRNSSLIDSMSASVKPILKTSAFYAIFFGINVIWHIYSKDCRLKVTNVPLWRRKLHQLPQICHKNDYTYLSFLNNLCYLSARECDRPTFCM